MVAFVREALVRNGAWLVLPPLAISFGLWASLPAAYASENFDHDIPAWLRLTETALRILVFVLPGALLVGKPSETSRAAWTTYAVGLGVYLVSYAWLASWPQSWWATSAVGFTAPAWTPAVWLLGIAMICRESWLTKRWTWWMYLPVVVGFLMLHIGHALLVWAR